MAFISMSGCMSICDLALRHILIHILMTSKYTDHNILSSCVHIYKSNTPVLYTYSKGEHYVDTYYVSIHLLKITVLYMAQRPDIIRS